MGARNTIWQQTATYHPTTFELGSAKAYMAFLAQQYRSISEAAVTACDNFQPAAAACGTARSQGKAIPAASRGVEQW
jgi:hypothetical protein